MKEISNRLDLEIKDKDGKIVKCYIDLDLFRRDQEFYNQLDESARTYRDRDQFSDTNNSK